jgi:hypothetical protein
MSFILDHFWKFLLLIAVAIGGKMYLDKSKSAATYDLAVGRYAAAITDLERMRLSSSQLTAWESGYWKLLARTDETITNIVSKKLVVMDEAGMPMVDSIETQLRAYLLSAAIKAGISQAGSHEGNPARLLTDTLIENYRTLDNYGVWSNPQSVREMNRGQAPLIASGPFAGEKAELTRRIAPQLYREGIFQLSNIQILPHPAAAVFMPEVDDKMRELALRLKEAKIMERRTFEAVDQQFQQSAALAQ